MTAFIGTTALDLAGAIARGGRLQLHQFQRHARRVFALDVSEESALKRLTEVLYVFHANADKPRTLAIAYHLMGASSLSLAAAIARRDRIPINVFDALAVAAFVSTITELQAIEAMLAAIESKGVS